MPDAETIRRIFPELSRLADRDLADRVVATWVRAWREAGIGEKLPEFPFYYRTPQESLISHVRKVVRAALALADVVAQEENGPAIDLDTLLAACLLHDVDKLLLYERTPDGLGWQPTRMSRRFAHGVLGAMLCREEGLPEVVVHLVATHTHDSTLTPEPYEGVILHYADFVAADTAFWKAGLPLLMKP